MMMPSVKASSFGTAPDGIGRVEVRVITASISASYHILIAPAAPDPSATAKIATVASTGLIPCPVTPVAATSPASAVNTTSIMMRGFSSST
eukprot:CAMPEP_0184472994 /NCGR_PEP_ID=MMETSP0740-20130409/118411_1 /TAXON_ID=385413 /ORGANISM="Thalassiosira miniscula, Strain CCMP1093" /LENGTH=90 /DNA_ID=CAMNT_0026849797 /DNA_START=89 /DNA_END=361 /DNA_ORIENTATION=-